MIGIVVDSSSQLPATLAERYGIAVVPLTVTVDGTDHLEGVDLTTTQFYEAWSDRHTPEISTSQPSPGAFIVVYERLIAAGADEILSVHVTEAMSGTLNSARIAADAVSVPVRLVDSGTASFGISCCAWAAAEAIKHGAGLDEAARIAEAKAAELATAFIVGVPLLTERSGRADGVGFEDAATTGIPVLAMAGGNLEVLDAVSTVEAAVEAMTEYATGRTPSSPDGLRVAIGTSDESSRPVSIALTVALRREPAVGEIVQYSIGPSIGAHTGPGTAGLFIF